LLHRKCLSIVEFEEDLPGSLPPLVEMPVLRFEVGGVERTIIKNGNLFKAS
jgi:hypothetical protein